MSKKYDAPAYTTPQLMAIEPVTGITVNGTIASSATIAAIRIPRGIKVSKLSVYNYTGGTAAGPKITVGYSYAGTGTLTNFGTANIAGTVADASGSAHSITATQLTSGDLLIIQKVAGTAAAAPVVSLCLEYTIARYDGAEA